MKRPEELARRFLALADRDIRAFRKLSDDSEIDDEIVGFHAQQAVEKCLKAILAKHRVEVRKTHDLQVLIELLLQHHVPSPPLREGIDALGNRDRAAESGASTSSGGKCPSPGGAATFLE